jgi:AcrR family transcriptional regulator
MNSYNERKNTYVKKKLLNTLLEMLKTQGIDSIVIGDLVEKAGVGRVSFYRNYSSKKDILIQEERRLFDEWDIDYKTRNENNSLDFNQELLDFYKRNSSLYLALFNNGMEDIIINSLLSSADIKEDDSNLIAYLKSSIAYLVYGWVHEWMKRGMQESGTELSQMMKQANNTAR